MSAIKDGVMRKLKSDDIHDFIGFNLNLLMWGQMWLQISVRHAWT